MSGQGLPRAWALASFSSWTLWKLKCRSGGPPCPLVLSLWFNSRGPPFLSGDPEMNYQHMGPRRSGFFSSAISPFENPLAVDNQTNAVIGQLGRLSPGARLHSMGSWPSSDRP